MKNKSIFIILSTVGLLLLIPLIAMQFTKEVKWTLADFLIAAVLLISTGLSINYTIKKIKRPIFRVALSITLLIILILVWMELAVAIFGTPLSGH